MRKENSLRRIRCKVASAKGGILQGKKNSGFSLVEMVIVIAISSIITLAASQIFLSGMKSFEESDTMQKNLEESRSAMEIMSKNIRMSKFTQTNLAGNVLYLFNSSQGLCVSYQFSNSERKLKSASCLPIMDEETRDPIGRCVISCAYTYNNMTNDVTGDFNVIQTDRINNPLKIGRATIRMTTGDTDNEKTIQTTISFLDYKDILQ